MSCIIDDRGWEDMEPEPETALVGDCSVDCLDGCAYPGQFSECWIGMSTDGDE